RSSSGQRRGVRMGNPGLSREQMQEAVDAVQLYGSIAGASRALNIPTGTVQNRYHKAVAAGITPGCPVAKPSPEFEYPNLPEPEGDVDDLIEHRIKQFEKKRRFEDARRLIQVKVKLDGPIGVWHFGDPHVDDDGTDLAAIREHTRIVRETPGL